MKLGVSIFLCIGVLFMVDHVNGLECVVCDGNGCKEKVTKDPIPTEYVKSCDIGELEGSSDAAGGGKPNETTTKDGIEFSVPWKDSGEISKGFVIVCVKQDVFIAASSPPGVNESSSEAWNKGGELKTTEPDFTNRYCGVITQTDLDNSRGVVEDVGGKFAVVNSYCKEDNCNGGTHISIQMSVLLISPIFWIVDCWGR